MDEFASIGQGILGYNMFAYFLNNPISRIDICGKYSLVETIDFTIFYDALMTLVRYSVDELGGFGISAGTTLGLFGGEVSSDGNITGIG